MPNNFKDIGWVFDLTVKPNTMLKFFYACLFLLVVCSTNILTGQNLKMRVPVDLEAPIELSIQDRQTIIQTLEKVLNEYGEAARFIIDGENQVTAAAVERFERLFSPTARIVKDYTENIPNDLIAYKDYSSNIFALMPVQGLQLRLEVIELSEIQDDPAGFYVAIVRVEKSTFNYVNAQGEVKTSSGRFFEQQFRFDIPKTNLDKASITRIDRVCKGKECDPADDYTRIFSFYAGGGSTSASVTTSSFWDRTHADNVLDASGGSYFSVGTELVLNRIINSRKARKKSFNLILGLRYSNLQIEGNLDRFEIDPFPVEATNGTESQEYMRMVGPVKGTEDISFGLIEIPIGVGYRLVENKRFQLHLQAKVLPTLALSASGDFSGQGKYDAIIAGTELRLLGENAVDVALLDNELGFGPYEVGIDQAINQSADPETAGFMLGFQVSPVLYFDFSNYNPTWGLMIGLDFTTYFSSPIEHDGLDEDLLQFKEEYQASLLQRYAEDLSMTSLGLRIGLYHKLDTEP